MSLEEARAAYDGGDWDLAVSSLEALNLEGSLEADDLDRLATGLAMLGRKPGIAGIRERAMGGHLENGDIAKAVHSGFWAGTEYVQMGQMAQAGGMLRQVQEVYETHSPEGPSAGWVEVGQGYVVWVQGTMEAAIEHLRRAVDIARKVADVDLTAIANFMAGRLLIDMGDVDEGLERLDEALLSITRSEASPVTQGVAYCGCIAAFMDVFEHERAREWTNALNEWIDPQKGRLIFRGQCLIFRSEIMQLAGQWDEALEESRLSVDELGGPYPNPFLAGAHYQLGELLRLRGDYTGAEESYSTASEIGFLPQPGLALLRLGQKQIEAAEKSIRTAMEGANDRIRRSKLLSGFVEIMSEVPDLASARDGSDELARIADEVGADFVKGLATVAEGAVLLAEGKAKESLRPLRASLEIWNGLDAPYEASRTRVLIAKACESLGDLETCAMEIQAARAIFQRLGAEPDLKAIGSLGGSKAHSELGLTGRELEVLALVATGKTNRVIAEELFIAEKTVARHISNIFTKLDVSSRTEATAYAYEHGLA